MYDESNTMIMRKVDEHFLARENCVGVLRMLLATCGKSRSLIVVSELKWDPMDTSGIEKLGGKK
jgi:hypothetical protein